MPREVATRANVCQCGSCGAVADGGSVSCDDEDVNDTTWSPPDRSVRSALARRTFGSTGTHLQNGVRRPLVHPHTYVL